MQELSSNQDKIYILTGGTGGHLKPALCIANKLVEKGIGLENIIVLGSYYGQDKEFLAKTDFKYVLFKTRGLKPSAKFSNFATLVELLFSIFKAFFVVKKTKYSVALSFGGHGALPGGLACVLKNIPIILINLDSEESRVNRILRPFASLVTAPEPINAKRGYWPVGIPLGSSILEISERRRDPNEVALAKKRLGINAGFPSILIMGGSLGSKTINEIGMNLESTLRNDEINIIHIVGKKHFGVSDNYMRLKRENFVVYSFLDDMTDTYLAADVAITRAGASSLAELACLGIKSVVIPIPNSPQDHQLKNARAYSKLCNFKLIEEKDLDHDKVLKEVLNLLEQKKETCCNSVKQLHLNSSENLANATLSAIGANDKLFR